MLLPREHDERAMSAIFISYRREDTVGHAGRIYDRLVARFGPERVYRDIDSGRPGEDFVETIRRRVAGCDVLLALIGPGWLKATDETGGWRLAQEGDLVRIEIATALERGVRVIPVLVQGAKMPRSGDLPVALSKLAHRNAVEIRDTQFDRDVSLLLEDLSPRSFHARWLRPLTRPAVAIALALVVAAGIGTVYLSQVTLTSEQARAQLELMDIPYSADAFVHAAERKDATAMALFLKAGMDPNAANRRGLTALQFAARHGDLAMMKSLIKAGARIEAPVRWAAGAGQMEALQLLLSKGPTKAALGEALTVSGHEPRVTLLLLDRGADPNAADKDGKTPLMDAADEANPEVARLLLARGVNVNAGRTDPFTRGKTALHYAAVTSKDEHRAIEVAALLLDKGADLSARAVDVNNSEGWTPLLAAALAKRWKMARFLAERGADVNALAVAHGGHDEAVGIGLTPVMLAVKEGELDTVVAFLDKGADVDRRTASGRTALWLAAERGSAPVVEVLLARGAKATNADNDGWTPLMAARTPEVAEVLLRHGAVVDARTTAGTTALIIAAERGSPEMVKLLLARGADANAVNKNGWTPLMAAAYAGQAASARALIEGGARKDRKNNAGETALDIARKENSRTVVDVLLAARG